ncbi:hypothetical protein JCM9279_007698 [Rhodotorula babjevae]
MPLRRARQPSTADTARAAKRLASIDAAFNRAAGYDPSRYADESDRPPQKRSRRAVVPDDEEDEADEDDVEMELVAGSAAPAGPGSTAAVPEGLGGGFLPEPADGGTGGGGFPVEDDEQPAGGFLPEPPGGGGGFLTEADQGAMMGGGFFPDASASDAGGGGGFLLPDPSSLDTPMPPADAGYGTAGGSLPPPDNLSRDFDPFAGAGGFLPDDDTPSNSLSSLLPTPAPLTNRLPTPPPPPSRIPLARIPAALRDLGLHRVGLAGAELIALFDDVASEDEDDPLRGRSVRRERFVEACEVLLGDEEPPSAEEEQEEDRAAEDDDLGLGEGRRRRRQPTRQQPSRRSTRGRRAAPGEVEEGEDEEAQDDVVEKDFGEAGVDDESSSSFASESDVAIDDEDDDDIVDVPAKGKKAAGKKGAKGRRVAKGDPSRPLSKQDLADAADTFDLFFDESPQLAFGQQERGITLMELQRACRVLKEKMTDGDLNEMLEYAAKSKGVVDLEAFARILREAGL